MHDPMTVAFDVFPYRWRQRFPWLPHFLTIWHVDPEKDGTDDSCGWFMRSRHGDQKVLERIVRRFEHEWDRVFESGRAVYNCGLFRPDGQPHFSVPGVVLNLFFMAVSEHFDSNGHTNGRKAKRFMNRNLLDILLFAENTTDSLFDGITRKFEIGCEEDYTDQQRADRIRKMASCIYAWIIRAERPWYKHPKWHFWHWHFQVHHLQQLRRWLLSRCEVCGRGFKWGESPVGHWDSPPPRRFEMLRGERGVRHTGCSNCSVGVVKEQAKKE